MGMLTCVFMFGSSCVYNTSSTIQLCVKFTVVQGIQVANELISAGATDSPSWVVPLKRCGGAKQFYIHQIITVDLFEQG